MITVSSLLKLTHRILILSQSNSVKLALSFQTSKLLKWEKKTEQLGVMPKRPGHVSKLCKH